MRVKIIALFTPEGVLSHITHGCDAEDTERLFELLKETRSAAKIPRMELHTVELGTPDRTHTKLK
jgi:hypothetical protein